MGVSEFDAFQSQLLRLLDLVHERNPTAIERNRLRQAITLRHGDWLGQVRGTPIEGLGRSLVGQLAKADAELTREQVTELDALALGRLPQVNEQRELAPTTATGATVDANIVHDILKPPRRHRVQALLDLQARGLVELAVSGHVREDIPEDPLATELQQLHELDVTGGVFRLDHSRLDGPDALGSQAFLAVQEELGADRAEPNEADWNHLHAHYAQGRGVFLTWEKSILALAPQLAERLGLIVETPDDFVKRFDT